MSEKDSRVHKVKEFNYLLSLIAQNDRDAFKILYDRYGKFIYATAMSITKNKTFADEVVNDVLFKIWQAAVHNQTINKISGWLYRITKNSALDLLRKEKETIDVELISVIDSNFEKVISENSFFYLIDSLSPFVQQVIILKEIRDLTFEEIASEMQKPFSTVASAYYRSIGKLKRKFRKNDE